MTAKLFIPLKEQDSRQLDRSINWRAIEQWANTLATGSLRAATKIVAASNALDATKADSDYVATGTGDQATINTALSALPAGGGKVLLSEGTFNITGSISMPANCRLEGQGKGTFLQATAGLDLGTQAMIQASAHSLSGIQVCNLAMDGNTAIQGTNRPFGIYLYLTSDYLLENLWFTNFRGAAIYTDRAGSNVARNVIHGIHMDSCATANQSNVLGALTIAAGDFDTVISDCIATNCGNAVGLAAFYINGAHASVVNCVADGSPYIGILLNLSQFVSLVGCHAYNCSYGIYQSTCNDCTVIACSAETSTNDGFTFDTCTRCLVAESNFADNGGAGIMVFQSNTDYAIRNCMCKGNSTSSNLGTSNIFVRPGPGGANDGSIIGCVCRKGTAANLPAYGIDISAAGDNNTLVLHNDLKNGGSTGAYHDLGTGTKVNLDGSANNWNKLA